MSEGVLIEGCAVAAVDAAGTEHAEGWILTDGPRIAGLGGGAPPPVPDGVRRIDGRGLPRHAGARQLPPPPLPVVHPGDGAGPGPLRLAHRALPASGRASTRRSSTRSARAGLAALARVGMLDQHGPPLPLPARRRRPARARRSGRRRSWACASTPAGGRWTWGRSAGRAAAGRGRRGPRRRPRRDRGRDRPLARPRVRVDAAHRRGAVLPVLGHAGAHDASRPGSRAGAACGCTPTWPRPREEEAFCLERFGVRPVEYLDDLDWLGPDVWLAHCVHLSPEEVGRLAATGTSVAHCPSSNARLGRRHRARPPTSRPPGVAVGLGVDGAASHESGELAVELRQALLVARLRGGAGRHDRAARRSPSARSTARAAWAARTRSARWSRASSPTSPSGASTAPGHAGHRRPGGRARAGPAAPGRGAAGERASRWWRAGAC